MGKSKNRTNGEGTFYYNEKRQCFVGQCCLGIKPDGSLNRITRYAKTQREVKEKIGKVRAEYLGKCGKNSDLTISNMVKKSIEEDYKLGLVRAPGYARNLDTYKIINDNPIGSIAVQALTLDNIKEFAMFMTKYSNSVIKKVFYLLNKALKRAVWDKLILENPMEKQSGFKMPKSQKDTKDIVALDLNEEIRLIAALKEFRSKPHPENYNDYTPQIIISLFTGMRMGEINALELSDINFERRKIKISKTISRGEKYESVVKNGTKTYAGKREVDLNIELQYILKDYILKVYPEVKGKGKDESINLLFLNKKSGGIITTNQVSTWLKEFCKKNEISNKVITSHVLRHTYATRCIESGMQIKVLQKLLGHEDVTTTINTYCDVFTEYEDENIETAQRYFKEKKLTFSDEQEPNN